jgi:hypothetical protein
MCLEHKGRLGERQTIMHVLKLSSYQAILKATWGILGLLYCCRVNECLYCPFGILLLYICDVHSQEEKKTKKKKPTHTHTQFTYQRI